MPGFAILIHDHPFLHWDLLLEQGDILRAWRLLREPDSGGDIPAEALPDHRRIYLEYEGPVSGDRGTVTQWDAGTFEPLFESADCLQVRLDGRNLQAIVELEADASESGWTFRRLTGDTSRGASQQGDGCD